MSGYWSTTPDDKARALARAESLLTAAESMSDEERLRAFGTDGLDILRDIQTSLSEIVDLTVDQIT